MTVTEILRTITKDDILNAINNYVFIETSRQGRPVDRFVSYENKDYPAKELLKQATPSLINTSNYSNNSYTSDVAQKRLEELGFTVNKKSQQYSYDWTYYIKRVLNQDVVKSFSISNEAAIDFFILQLNNGQDQQIELNYINNNQKLTTRFNKRNTRNEYRFFPYYREAMEEDDILLFTRNDFGYSIEIIKKNNESFEDINKLLDLKNHFLTNSITPNKSIQMKTNMIIMPPLNQILYGPPGTGKTDATVEKALEILDLKTEDRTENRKFFRSLLNKKIFFVTMHPSYSYEDFVQGIKPKTSSKGDLLFEPKSGIFKIVSDLAKTVYENDGEIIDNEIDNSDILRICFFLSKFNTKTDRKANLVFGSKSPGEVFSSIGKKFNVNPNSLKNHRDKFDFLTTNERKGWQPHNGSSDKLDNTPLWPYSDIYNELNSETFDAIKNIIDGIEKKTKTTTTKTEANINYVLILDEINRANISKVFGELITLLEEDKRIGKENELSVTLPSGDKFFSVPPNLFIIGTMNTADKSIALVDIALRRRFQFIPIYPKPEVIEAVKSNEWELKKDFMISVNKNLIDQKGKYYKGVDFQIGHAYFLKNNSLKDVINENVIPLLTEYFRNDLEKVKGLLFDCGKKLDEEYFNQTGLLKYDV